MKAAVLYETGCPLVVENDIEVPKLRAGQVLVKLHFSGVCHSQLMEARGKRGDDPYLPHMLGHEGSATVLEVGPEVTRFKKDDVVILTWIKCLGADVSQTKYSKGNQIINAGGVTTFSEYSVVSENRCVALPEGVPLDIASLFGCAVLTGAGIVTNTIQPSSKNSLAIFGLGGIGLSALMAACLYECQTLIAVDIEKDKLELAIEFGATHVIDSSMENPVDRIREITEGVGVDYSIEAAGLVKTIEKAFQSVRKGGGKCVFATHPTANEKIMIDPFDLICGKQIQGSWGGDSIPEEDIPKFAQLYRDGKLPLEKLLTRRYSLDQINEALDDLEQRKVGRPLIAFSDHRA
ncbi:MAG: zinc-binding dehydrogenase [Opitutae bacterium]|jgi:S-(hydroxymethyl)glutathione dehydrogenase / alcohol dehydrogenase|nr:zinc-binding dehydrogenase [Opitutae bacterium]